MTSEASPVPPENSARPTPPRENVWVNLFCNAILPGLLLTKLSRPERLGPVWALVIAVSIPLVYGIYDLIRRRKWNIFSVLGIVGTLLTGGLGLMKTANLWFAVKEAAIPLILGLAIPISLRTKKPLVREMLYNDQVLDTHRIGAALAERGSEAGFDRELRKASWRLAGSFFLSAVLNYFLARWLVTATPGSPEHAAQIGKLNGVSWPVIVLPSMAIMMVALFRLLKGLERLTGLKGEELFHARKG
jgi:hypothetical protein